LTISVLLWSVGNVSQALPAFYFVMKTHPAGINWHSTEVAEGAVSDQAHEAMLMAAKAMAWPA